MTAPLVRSLGATTDEVEVVEHKGTGHPDTICDAVAEAASAALSRLYLERFGAVLHHNVDKALLVGGRAAPAFGGGEVTEPITIILAGRATDRVRDVDVPAREVVVEAARSWLRHNLHELDVDQHVRIEAMLRPGSADLVELFLRRARSGVHLANDTSCGAGYAPLSPTERAVLGVAEHLDELAQQPSSPEVGEDVKVMAVRSGSTLELTVACALIGRHLRDLDHYFARRRALVDAVRARAETATRGALSTSAVLNAADDPTRGSVFLTVTGTSAEAGDDGEVGRGNRVNGLITPYRPMTLEAAAGKNPVSHVGKLYNVAAHALAADVVAEIPEVTRAECFLVSRIGRRVEDPQLVDVRVALREDVPLPSVAGRIAAVAQAGVARIPALAERILRGDVRLY